MTITKKSLRYLGKVLEYFFWFSVGILLYRLLA